MRGHHNTPNAAQRDARDRKLCPASHKVCLSRKQALERTKQMDGPGQEYNAYRCVHCRDWHVGRKLDKDTLIKIKETNTAPRKTYEADPGTWHPRL